MKNTTENTEKQIKTFKTIEKYMTKDEAKKYFLDLLFSMDPITPEGNICNNYMDLTVALNIHFFNEEKTTFKTEDNKEEFTYTYTVNDTPMVTNRRQLYFDLMETEQITKEQIENYELPNK